MSLQYAVLQRTGKCRTRCVHLVREYTGTVPSLQTTHQEILMEKYGSFKPPLHHTNYEPFGTYSDCPLV